MKCLKFGLILLCLLVLGACSNKPLTSREVVIIAPPEALLKNCSETPIPNNGLNGDLLDLAVSQSSDLAECNRKNARLRQWVEQQKSTGKSQ